MRKRKAEGAVGLLLIAAVVVIAVVFLRPKSLAAVLGDGFSPERVTAVSAILSPATGGTQITLEIPAEEEAFGQLLALLQEPSYSRTFAKDDQFTLGYVVYLSFATEETWAWSLSFPGGQTDPGWPHRPDENLSDLRRPGHPGEDPGFPPGPVSGPQHSRFPRRKP